MELQTVFKNSMLDREQVYSKNRVSLAGSLAIILMACLGGGVALVTIYRELIWNQTLGHGVNTLSFALRHKNYEALLKARDILQQATKMSVLHDNGVAYYNLGIAELQMRAGRQALEAFNQAEKTHPRFELYWGRAQVFNYLLNDKRRAFMDYQRALAMKPNFEMARQSLNGIGGPP